MFLETLWANLTYLLSYVDPIVNRNTNDDKTLWQGFLNSSMEMSNNAYNSIVAQVDISHYVDQISNITINCLDIVKNATKTIGMNVYSGEFSSVIDILKFEVSRKTETCL